MEIRPSEHHHILSRVPASSRIHDILIDVLNRALQQCLILYGFSTFNQIKHGSSYLSSQPFHHVIANKPMLVAHSLLNISRGIRV